MLRLLFEILQVRFSRKKFGWKFR